MSAPFKVKPLLRHQRPENSFQIPIAHSPIPALGPTLILPAPLRPRLPAEHAKAQYHPLAPEKPLQPAALFLLLAALADDADHLRLHRTHVAGGVAADVLTRAGQARPKGSRLASLLQKTLVHTGVAAPTETCRTNRNRPRQRNPPLLDLAVGATQVASLSTRSASPSPPNRRSGVSAVLMMTSLEGFRDSI